MKRIDVVAELTKNQASSAWNGEPPEVLKPKFRKGWQTPTRFDPFKYDG